MSHLRKHRYHYLVAVAFFVFVSLGVTLFSSIKPVHAAAGSIYLSPSSTSVQIGNSFTVALRITPGGTVDGAQATLNFSSSQLSLTSIDSTSSAFSVQLSQTSTATTATVARGALSGGVSSDSLIANFTFKALVGTGTGSITLSNANATNNGTYTNPSTANGSVTFTTPACPSGYTGTYPNCVAPVCPAGDTGAYPNCVAPTCPTGYTGKYPNCVAPVKTTTPPPTTGSGGSSTTTTTTTKTSTPTSSTKASTVSAVNTAPTTATTTATTVGAASVTATASTAYTTAAVAITTSTPTTAYIEYGTTPQFGYETTATPLETAHTLNLDSSLLSPGKVYYYSIVATTANGIVTKTPVQTVATKGMTLSILVKDASGQPLANQVVTLHSTPVTARTDADGNVTFTNVAPGSHELIYTNGSKQYIKPLTVANVIIVKSGQQATIAQSFAIAYDFNPGTPIIVYILLAIIVIILGALAFSILYFRHHSSKLIALLVPKTAGGHLHNFEPIEGLRHLVQSIIHHPTTTTVNISSTTEVPPTPVSVAEVTSIVAAPPVEIKEEKPDSDDDYKEFVPSNFVQPTPHQPTNFENPSFPSSEKNPWQKP